MIKSFYTANKKRNIFTAYKYHYYKLSDFAMAMVRVNGFPIGWTICYTYKSSIRMCKEN